MHTIIEMYTGHYKEGLMIFEVSHSISKYKDDNEFEITFRTSDINEFEDVKEVIDGVVTRHNALIRRQEMIIPESAMIDDCK